MEYPLDHPYTIRLYEKEYPLEKIAFGIHFSKSNEPSNSIRSEIHFQFAPHVCRIEVSPAFEDGTPKELATEGQLVCECCNKDHGILREWASKVVFDGVFRRQPDVVKQFYDGVRRSPNGEARLKLEWKIGDRKILRFRGNDYPLDAIAVEVHAISAKAPLDCKQYELAKPDGEGQLLSHLEATAGGKKFSIVIPHFESGHPDKIVLKVDNAQKVVSDSDSIREH